MTRRDSPVPSILIRETTAAVQPFTDFLGTHTVEVWMYPESKTVVASVKCSDGRVYQSQSLQGLVDTINEQSEKRDFNG
jgi:hypothetical protein